MAFEAHAGVGFGHARPIVHDLNEVTPGLAHDDLHGFGVGIDRVFEQFFHHGSGPLHHLTGGNLVGNGIGQKLDDVVHGGSERYSML